MEGKDYLLGLLLLLQGQLHLMAAAQWTDSLGTDHGSLFTLPHTYILIVGLYLLQQRLFRMAGGSLITFDLLASHPGDTMFGAALAWLL